jgi:hypothetical protein
MLIDTNIMREVVAAHEAGHAAVAIEYGFPIIEVTIESA